MKKYSAILLLILIAFVLRLWLTDKGWHVDMLSNAGWGEWIYSHGPAKFYDNNIWTYSWPTQPPLINSIYGWNKNLYISLLGRLAWIDFQLKKLAGGGDIIWLSGFVKWFAFGKINNEIPYQIGYLVTMKLLPILSDLGIALAIYFISGKKWPWAAIYLISPFSWYISALWGQYDQAGFLMALLAFLTVGRKGELLSPALMTAAVLIKPTSLILIPFYGYWYLRKGKGSPLTKISGIFIAFSVFWMTTAPFTYKNPLVFARYDLTRIIFEKSEPRISVNAFNFWRIFIGDTAANQSRRFLFIPGTYWSLLAFALLNLLAIIRAERETKNNFILWECLFLIATGGWLFMTGMLERYLFAGIVCGLILTVFRPDLFGYWLLMSLVYWLNLFYHWWYPPFLSPIKDLLLWNDGSITRWLSGINVCLFLVIILKPLILPKWKPVNFQKLPFLPVQWRKAAAGIWLLRAGKHN